MTETIPATFEVLDERFRACSGDGRIERLAGRCRWAEGPVYVPAGRYLVWSDIPNDRMLRWDEATEAVGVFRQPAGYTNGNTLDAEGRMLSCEHGGRRVSRTEHDGSVTTIADRIDGKRLNHIRRFALGADGRLTDAGVFAECTAGVFDGIRLDTTGRIWAAAGDGVHCYAPDGTLLGKLLIPETVSNLVFGGPKRNRLFVAASTSIYSILLNVNGAPGPWQQPRG